MNHFIRSASSLPLLSLPLLLAACGTTEPPSTFVTSTADSGPGTLRAVLESTPAGETVRFNTPGTVTLASPLVITRNVTVLAEGVTIDAAQTGRALEVREGATVTFRGGTFKNGTGGPATGPLSLSPQATAPTLGGLILNSGSLLLDQVTLTGGTANDGGAIYNHAGATLTLKSSTLTGNKATAFPESTLPHGMGGAVFNAGTLRIEDSTLSGNEAAGGGGAIYNAGVLTLVSGAVTGNTSALPGGGIRNANGSAFTQSGGTVTGNTPDNVVTFTAPDPAASGDFVFPARWTVSSPAEVRRGGTLREGILTPSMTLNPFRDATSGSLIQTLSEGGLLRQDPVTDEFIPYMAQSYTVSADGRTWDFTLRPDLKWSDGRPITADDFVTTAKLHQDPAIGSNSYDSLVGVTVSRTAPDGVRIVFAAPQATAEATVSFTPWPNHVFGAAYASGGAAAVRALWPITTSPADVVSAGPFRLGSVTQGGAAVLERNPYYGEWAVDSAGQPLPYLDRIEYLPFVNTDAQLNAFLAGGIDLFSPSQAQLPAVRGATGVVLRENYSATASSTWITWNWNRASDPEKQRLFRSDAFRQAMSHLTDRDRMVQEVLAGAGNPVFTSVYPVFTEWLSPTAPKFTFNVMEARRLLATLGYDRLNSGGYLTNSDGRVLEFDLMTNAGNAAREGFARIFAEGARQAGVKVNVQLIDFNTLISRFTAKGADRPFDALLLGLSGGSNLFPFGVNTVRCDGNLHVYNQSGACLTAWEQELQTLYLAGAQEFNRAKRLVIGRQIQDLEAQHQPYVYLAAARASAAWRARVRGELPADVADSYYGTRVPALTWVQD